MILNEWIDLSRSLCREEATVFCGCRKIIRDYTWTVRDLDGKLTLDKIGFTKSKMSMLKRNYYNEESVEAAIKLWNDRIAKDKYGSVGISTYNHFIKGSKGKRGSVMGPCIQAITLTWIDKTTVVDVFYRTTEVFKKFPADIVFLRDEVLSQFDLPNLNCINFKFSNVTVHPMYWIAVAPYFKSPLVELEAIRDRDERLWIWIIKWTGRYLCPEYANGIQKFSQALRTRDSGLELLPQAHVAALQGYIRKNWPGQLRGKKK